MRVVFPGHGEFWLISGGALAPLEHADAEGNILPEHAFSVSYAHVFPGGDILQFGNKIGQQSDLLEVK